MRPPAPRPRPRLCVRIRAHPERCGCARARAGPCSGQAQASQIKWCYTWPPGSHTRQGSVCVRRIWKLSFLTRPRPVCLRELLASTLPPPLQCPPAGGPPPCPLAARHRPARIARAVRPLAVEPACALGWGPPPATGCVGASLSHTHDRRGGRRPAACCSSSDCSFRRSSARAHPPHVPRAPRIFAGSRLAVTTTTTTPQRQAVGVGARAGSRGGLFCFRAPRDVCIHTPPFQLTAAICVTAAPHLQASRAQWVWRPSAPRASARPSPVPPRSSSCADLTPEGNDRPRPLRPVAPRLRSCCTRPTTTTHAPRSALPSPRRPVLFSRPAARSDGSDPRTWKISVVGDSSPATGRSHSAAVASSPVRLDPGGRVLRLMLPIGTGLAAALPLAAGTAGGGLAPRGLAGSTAPSYSQPRRSCGRVCVSVCRARSFFVRRRMRIKKAPGDGWAGAAGSVAPTPRAAGGRETPGSCGMQSWWVPLVAVRARGLLQS